MAALLPSRVAITGPHAVGFVHEGDCLEITVVADQKHWADLDPRLAHVAVSATEAVPSLRPKVRILSPEQWPQADEGLGSHHYVWLTPSTSSRAQIRKAIPANVGVSSFVTASADHAVKSGQLNVDLRQPISRHPRRCWQMRSLTM